VDENGEIARQFVTLINPQRDMGPSSIHGLSAEDVSRAPSFAEVAGHIVAMLEGIVAIAGHNVRFDESFLRSEFGHMNVPMPDCMTVCTMQLAGGGRLSECCCDYGVSMDGTAHHALADAMATARLLSLLLPDQPRVLDQFSELTPIAWPGVPSSARLPLTRDESRKEQSEMPAFLQRLLSRKNATESAPDGGAEMAYSALLDRVLEDRQIDESEAAALLETAKGWGLDGVRIKHVHDGYLRQLAMAAVADGTVTDSERRDLTLVARLLGKDEATVDRNLEEAGNEQRPAVAAPAPEDNEKLAGKRVCFTGELQCTYQGAPIPRDLAEDLATKAGLIVCDSVTKKLDLLVIADPHSQSGKAKKARSYGVRIMHEPLFWTSIGIVVE
jgi:DNA polymerase-3 subunit epsilon